MSVEGFLRVFEGGFPMKLNPPHPGSLLLKTIPSLSKVIAM